MKNAEFYAKKINKKTNGFKPQIGVLLGSGLSNAFSEFVEKFSIDYESLGMPASKVKGHLGKFVFGTYNGKNVVKFTRYHFFENGDREQVKLPFEIIKLLGVETIIMATATGGINEKLDVGDVMLITDHINLTGNHPFINMSQIEFVDVKSAYKAEFFDEINKVSIKNKIKLKKGVHAQLSGPSYETPAEINMLKVIGADTVSMSTAYDIIISAYLNIKVIPFAVVANKANAIGGEELSHEDVLLAGEKACKNLKIIINHILEKL